MLFSKKIILGFFILFLLPRHIWCANTTKTTRVRIPNTHKHVDHLAMSSLPFIPPALLRVILDYIKPPCYSITITPTKIVAIQCNELMITHECLSNTRFFATSEASPFIGIGEPKYMQDNRCIAIPILYSNNGQHSQSHIIIHPGKFFMVNVDKMDSPSKIGYKYYLCMPPLPAAGSFSTTAPNEELVVAINDHNKKGGGGSSLSIERYPLSYTAVSPQ